MTSTSTAKPKPPKGWYVSGHDPNLYEASSDSTNPHSGTRCAYLRSTSKVADKSWATLMQDIRPEKYQDKRIRMSLWVRTRDVKGYVQPWMRVDGEHDNKSLSFDNMCTRYIQGDTDWTQYSIVLDVPKESRLLAFGVILGNKGQVWFDDVSFEEVGKDVPITDCPCSRNGNIKATEARNLDFEEDDQD